MLPFIVVDASVAGAWLFPEPYSRDAQPVLAALDAGRIIALAPDRFAEEMLRVCQKKASAGRVAAGDAWIRFLDVITSPIELISSEELHERAWQIALAAQLTTHDALYIAVAERWSAELWTLDDLLAARGVTVYPAIYDLSKMPFRH